MTDINFKKIKAWPFQEALKLKNRISKMNNKKNVTFETGYGPSGDPHIGTFAEVLRTNMVRNCLKQISNFSTNLITFSDDLDALRKVPDDYPFPEKLEKYINCPLSMIPDFTGKYNSYADRNNNILKDFLNNFGFEYNFISSTGFYKKGKFDKQLLIILKNYDKIMNVILPTLRKERRESYSPFLPICKQSKKVLQVPIKIIDKQNGIIAYKKNNHYEETLVTGGNCKLQWKVDWAMRWSALDVDYEMNGKDLIPSYELSSKISNFIENKVPVNMSYELFLDNKGEKISKSKGNGILIEDWLKYASHESLAFYMYQNPQRAKKLYPEAIPKAVDEYLNFLEKFIDQDTKEKLGNPVWHVHNGKPPVEKIIISFAVLLNLVSASNAEDQDIIWKFIKNYNTKLNKDEFPILKTLIGKAIVYYKDIVKPKKIYRKPNETERNALNDLVSLLSSLDEKLTPSEIQTEVFTIGKKYYPKEKLRDWFKAIYEIVFGDQQGPRMGSFIKFYGTKETKELIESKIK